MPASRSAPVPEAREPELGGDEVDEGAESGNGEDGGGPQDDAEEGSPADEDAA